MFLLARKPEKEAAGQQATPRATGAPAAGSRIAETIRTKVVGVTFQNDDVESRNVLIPELVGWVTSCGYDATIKPESFAASSIANKYSK